MQYPLPSLQTAFINNPNGGMRHEYFAPPPLPERLDVASIWAANLSIEVSYGKRRMIF
jgi:hypothetical protein